MEFSRGQRVFVRATDDTPASHGTIIKRHDVDDEPGYIVLLDTGTRDLVHAELIEARNPNPTGRLHSSETVADHEGHLVQYSLKKPNNGDLLSDATGQDIAWSFEDRAYVDHDSGKSVGANFDEAAYTLGVTDDAIETIRDDWSDPARTQYHQRPEVKKANRPAKAKKAAKNKKPTKPQKAKKATKSQGEKDAEHTKNIMAAMDEFTQSDAMKDLLAQIKSEVAQPRTENPSPSVQSLDYSMC